MPKLSSFFSFKRFKLAFFSLGLFEKAAVIFLLCVFAGSLIGIILMAESKISVEQPAFKGVLKEGVIGVPRFINPLLAVSQADRDLSSLIFSGLLRPDGKGGLEPDLAEKYEISPDGLNYTFLLRNGLKWHDKKSLTSDDILYTFQMAKHPGLKSYWRPAFEDAEIEIIDNQTVKFSLKKPSVQFLENMMFGILPRHILENLLPEELVLNGFNLNPIGSGPYRILKIEKDASGITRAYILKAYSGYHLKKTFIPEIVFKFYSSKNQMFDDFLAGGITSLSGIDHQDLRFLKEKAEFTEKNLKLSRIFAIFFNQNKNEILIDSKVRKALAQAIDKNKIVKEVLAGYGETINDLLANIESDSSDQEGAKKILKSDGWLENKKTGVLEKKRKKDKLILSFSLSVPNSPELIKAAEIIKDDWEKLGAKIAIKIFELNDFNQNIIRTRDFEAMLFGMVFGQEPDLYAFWHSSQRLDPGLNVSLYTSIKADKLLEKYRETIDQKERNKIYLEFQEELKKDIPAVFLYSPYFIYLLPKEIKNFENEKISRASERFANIHHWYLKTEKAWRLPSWRNWKTR